MQLNSSFDALTSRIYNDISYPCAYIYVLTKVLLLYLVQTKFTMSLQPYMARSTGDGARLNVDY